MTENWLPVVGYEGLYEVSDQGRVRSLTRCVAMSAGSIFEKKTIKGILLTPGDDTHGYKHVVLCRDRIRKTSKIHQLVMFAFVGPNPSRLLVLHQDGNPANNILSNLRYGTHQDNMDDKVRHGSQARHFGETNPQSKLTVADVVTIRNGSETQRIVAQKYGINQSVVSEIRSGKAWAHV